MSKYKLIKKKGLYIFFMFTIILTACTDDNVPGPEVTDFSDQLQNITRNVIIATYNDLEGKANTLFTEVQVFESDRSATNLNNVRGAWRDTRVPWESDRKSVV